MNRRPLPLETRYNGSHVYGKWTLVQFRFKNNESTLLIQVIDDSKTCYCD